MPKFEFHQTPDDWLINNTILDDTVKAILSEMPVNRNYNIPYVAGYSVNGKILYIDKNMPIGFTDDKGKFWHTDRYILIHEAIEKALMMRYKLPYLFAHQVALRVEQVCVVSDGCDWNQYNAFCMQYVKKIAHIEPQTVPKDLDLTPYKQEKDVKIVKELQALMEQERNPYAAYLAGL